MSLQRRKWYHKLCIGSQKHNNTPRTPQQQQEVCEVIDNITEAAELGTSWSLEPILKRIYHSEEDFTWEHPRNLRDGKVVRAVSDGDAEWSCWESIVENDPFIFIFGVRSNRSRGGYLYISARNGSITLTEDDPPSRTETADDDNRLFRYYPDGLDDRKTIFEHVATGMFVGLENKQSTKRKLILIPQSERAASWEID